LLRPLYLEYPKLSEAYKHPHEYFFGKEILVAPVVDSTGTRTIYLPLGEWNDFFTGKSYKGAQSFTTHYNVDQMPVFVRAGSIIPEQTPMAYSNQRPLDTLIVRIYGSKPGSFNLYEDDGISLNYKKGQFARTSIKFSKKGGSTYQLTIGPTHGRYAGQVKERAYIVRIQGIQKPQSVSINHQPVVKSAGSGTGWYWDAHRSMVIINVPLNSIRDTVQVELTH
jgi:alpha-glucosidase (family GH31 glycosyl hydrolase)